MKQSLHARQNHSMPTNKYLIFDMDGVIVDSEAVNIASELAVLEKAGVRASFQEHTQYLGVTAEVTWADLKKKYSLPLDIADYIAQAAEETARYFEENDLQPISGIHHLIDWLLENGWHLAVASSSSRDTIDHHLKAIHLSEAFTTTVSTEEVGASKPAPDVFLKAAEYLGADPKECLVIEDSRNGSIAAKAAGMTCIGFANPDYPPQDLSICDSVVTDYEQLYPYLENFNLV